MKAIRLIIALFLLGISAFAVPTVRIKDIADLRGIRDNQLVGIGLVTGLAGRGDSQNSELLKTAIANLVSNFGFRIDAADVRSRNCAVVTVSCQIPPFVRAGETVDIVVSSIGDARTLEGGVLLQTPLKAANGEIYALAQGQIFSPQSARGNNLQTVGTVPGGAIIEQDVLSTFLDEDSLSILLRHPDFVTANTVSTAIRQKYPEILLQTVDAAMIELSIPESWQEDPVGFIADLESIEVTPEPSNKVVIDSSSGVIIFGEQVRIGKVAVSYQDISVNVGPYGRPAGSFWAEDETERNFVFEQTTTVEDLVETLRTIGLETEMIIHIIKAIDRAGSLYGNLVVQ
ncbi:MAG: flagellar basal body P-ring protein FlgI [Spirochaetaceae bacterium]|nr:MAG: flagellar basal body P-ring protein FlgI [Spirochaetaceae bacterium]